MSTEVIYEKSGLIADDGTPYRTMGTLSIIKQNNLVFLEWKVQRPLVVTSLKDGWEEIEVINDYKADQILLSKVDTIHYNLSKFAVNSTETHWHIFSFPSSDATMFIIQLRRFVYLEKISVNNYKVLYIDGCNHKNFRELATSLEGFGDPRGLLAHALSGIASLVRPKREVKERVEELRKVRREAVLGVEEMEALDRAGVRRRAFLGGLDGAARRRVWAEWLGDGSRREEEYLVMKRQWSTMTDGQWKRNQVLAGHLSMIEKDVHRTDRETEYFSREDNLAVLRDVLLTYCCYDADLGYIQGMNDLLSMLLMAFDDEVTSFWCFCHLMERTHANFEPDLPGIRQQLSEFWSLLERVFPDLHHHLFGRNVSEVIFCLRWFIVFFKREFSLEDTFLVWDAILSGEVTNFHYYVGLALLAECRQDIVTAADTTDIIHIINTAGSRVDVQEVLSVAVGIYFRVSQMDSLKDFTDRTDISYKFNIF